MGGTSNTTNWALIFSESVRRWSAVSWLEVALAFAFIGIVSAYSWIQSVKRKLPLPYPGKRGVVQCSCGKCKLTLRNYKPRFRLECNCFDCRKRMEWSKSLGCQYLANKHYSGLFDGLWLDNAITDFTGGASVWKLRKGSPLTMLVADCCGTIMGALHPAHRTNVFVVPRYTMVAAADIGPPKLRILSDQSHFDIKSLPPYAGDGLVLRSRGVGDWRRPLFLLKMMFGAGTIYELLRVPAREPQDFTFQDILAGKPIKVVGASRFEG